jgi:hypothetical protein
MREIKDLKSKIPLLLGAIVILLLALFKCTSCSQMSDSEEETQFAIEGQTEEGFEDGTYCADVNYYNPNTGTSNDYTLEVEVSGNEVTQINFGNGGWLDSDHMTPETLDENGECTITSEKNYEYSIKITGRDCGFSNDINPETDEDMPRYTFTQCAEMLNLSDEEREHCLRIYEEDQLISESGFKDLELYVNKLRKINADYKRQMSNIQGKQDKLQNEINEGYITNIEIRTAFGIKRQIITIKKRGVNYLLEVSGNSECTMGTARFDENKSGWQMVYIKQYPDRDEFSVHYMRIIERGI